MNAHAVEPRSDHSSLSAKRSHELLDGTAIRDGTGLDSISNATSSLPFAGHLSLIAVVGAWPLRLFPLRLPAKRPMQETNTGSQKIDIAALYPDLTQEQQAEAAYYLARYLAVVRGIFERVHGLTEPDETNKMR